MSGLLAYQGKADCTSVTCTRNGEGKCVGWHCPTCDASTSYQGHRCPNVERHRIEHSHDDSTGYELWNCRDCSRSGGVSPLGRGDTDPKHAAENVHEHLGENVEVVHLLADRCLPIEDHHVTPHRGCWLR